MPTRPTRREPPTESLTEEEVAAKYAQLQTAVARKRMREEVEDMEEELAGRPRRIGVSPAGSRIAGSELPIRARALAPPTFTGKSLGELRRYLQGCVVYFDAIGEYSEERRVVTAASYLRDDALSQWTRLPRNKPASWEEYESTLRDMVEDPANRTGNALLAVKQASQKQVSVRELATILDELWEDIPKLAEEELRAWALVNAFRPDLRTAVLREERTISSRSQVIASAQRLELLGTTPGIGPRNPLAISKDAGTTQTAESEGASGDKRECFVCGERGHLARHCPKKKSQK